MSSRPAFARQPKNRWQEDLQAGVRHVTLWLMCRKLFHDWCERNQVPILEVLRPLVPQRGTVLEVASGSGQHAAFFAAKFPEVLWQPSDIDDERLDSIRAWSQDAGCANLAAPVRLDVLEDHWPVGHVDVVFCANLIHIAPWECCLGLVDGARRHLVDGGLLILYGPFRIGGAHTALSNRLFDDRLRSKDSNWGVRDLEKVRAAAIGFTLDDEHEMPANNRLVVFRKTSKGGSGG